MSELEALHEQIRVCPLCRLSESRKHAVPGDGSPNAAIMLVGEAPGFHENEQGRPFVGAAGRFLEQLLASINLSRDQVFITNIVKCRPPDNRDPRQDEIEACSGYLERQIELVAPKLIVTLGRFSMQLAYQGVTISKVHGQPKRVDDIVYLPMFHPAAALHQSRYRSLIEQDFAKIPEILSGLQSVGNGSGGETPPEQLSLF